MVGLAIQIGLPWRIKWHFMFMASRRKRSILEQPPGQLGIPRENLVETCDIGLVLDRCGNDRTIRRITMMFRHFSRAQRDMAVYRQTNHI